MAVVGGKDGSLSFSGDSITTTEVLQWRARFSRRKWNITPVGYAMPRFYKSRLMGDGVIVIQQISNNVQPLPTGTVGTATLTSSSGRAYTGKISLHELDVGIDVPNDAPQSAVYGFSFEGTTTSDTISVT